MVPDVKIIAGQLSSGLVGVNVSGLPGGVRMKVHTNLHGQPEYHYSIYNDGVFWYPLTQGNGTYIIRLLIETAPGSGYIRPLMSEPARLELADPNTVFLQSCVNMLWRQDMECIQLAKSLISGRKSDKAKFIAIWQYITGNFSYDDELAAEIIKNNRKYNYTPDIERIFSTKKDICFGLTAIFNSMLRSIGLPARMVHGVVKRLDAYHAWSNVLIDGAWKLVDVTFDMPQKLAEPPTRMGADYEVRFVY